MQNEIYNTDALYIGDLSLSNYALLLVVVLLLSLIALLLWGIPNAIGKVRG